MAKCPLDIHINVVARQNSRGKGIFIPKTANLLRAPLAALFQGMGAHYRFNQLLFKPFSNNLLYCLSATRNMTVPVDPPVDHVGKTTKIPVDEEKI